jgi:caffeoyl-CoA O-methyltransferase
VKSILKVAGTISLIYILGLTHNLMPLKAQEPGKALDEKVRKFLDKMRYQWRDLNVPDEDGKILYDIIIRKRYTRALELGTSTGRSGTWIAWALSKTGGKLITVEVDRERHDEAVRNFSEAGLGPYIDARFADAHKLVQEVAGPFDFIFIDADKDWYRKYAEALIPKMATGGCLAAHNVHEDGGFWRRGETGDFYEYVKNLPNLETSILPESRAGMSVSYKTR